MKWILKIILNSVGIYFAGAIIPDFLFQGTITELFFVGVVFTLSNGLFGELLKFLFRPLIFLSLGILALIINMAMLSIADFFSSALSIHSALALFWATLLLTVINIIPLTFPHLRKNK